MQFYYATTDTRIFIYCVFPFLPPAWHLFILVTYSVSFSVFHCIFLFYSFSCIVVGEFININEFCSMKVKLKFTSVYFYKGIGEGYAALWARNKLFRLIGGPYMMENPMKSCLELCISAHSFGFRFPFFFFPISIPVRVYIHICAFPILILLSKPPDISFLIPYSTAFFRVWKLYLSGCLLFGLIICQKKKLSQIEYLHKFIETAMERVIFEKGKDNIEGVVPGLILAFCPSFEACISKALPWLNPFYDFSAFANFVSCI